MKPDFLWRLTLNAGRTRRSPRSEVSDEALEQMRQMGLLEKKSVLPFPGWSMLLSKSQGCHAFSLLRNDHEVVTCSLCVNAEKSEQLWSQVQSYWLKITDEVPFDFPTLECPTDAPWLAVILVDPLTTLSAPWLGNFERRMAWLLIEDDLLREQLATEL